MAKRKNKSSEAMIFCSGVVIGAVGFFILTKITLNHPVKNKAVMVKPVQKNNRDLDQARIGKQFSKAGYLITWLKPRYEFDETSFSDTFKVDIKLQNILFEPIIRLIANCDLTDSGKIIKEGEGVRIDAPDDHLDPGESINFTIVVLLEIDYTKKSQIFADDRNLPGGHVSLFPNRRVSSCSFSPTGSYDPNIAVKVVFE